MASIDILETEIEEIKKQLSYLIKTSNDNNNGDGEGSGETPSQTDDWTTLYDCTSEDANINLGYPNGIKGSTGTIATFPDLMPYKYLKIDFQASNDHENYEYDISDSSTSNSHQILFPSRQLTTFYLMNFIIAIRDGKRTIHFGSCKEIIFYTNKYTGVNDLKTSDYFYIKKILAK